MSVLHLGLCVIAEQRDYWRLTKRETQTNWSHCIKKIWSKEKFSIGKIGDQQPTTSWLIIEHTQTVRILLGIFLIHFFRLFFLYRLHDWWFKSVPLNLGSFISSTTAVWCTFSMHFHKFANCKKNMESVFPLLMLKAYFPNTRWPNLELSTHTHTQTHVPAHARTHTHNLGQGLLFFQLFYVIYKHEHHMHNNIVSLPVKRNEILL